MTRTLRAPGHSPRLRRSNPRPTWLSEISIPRASDSRETLVPEAELGFEAFRYVAGEMSDAESAEFEERLAIDQPAREAVARAVEIAQAVTVLGPQAVVAGGAEFANRRRDARRSALVTLVATVAACIAVAVALDPFGRTERDPSRDEGMAQSARPANAARLVEFWTDADDLLSPADAAAVPEGFSWLDEPTSAGENGSGENGSESDFAWMLAAVSAEFPPAESGRAPEASQEN